MVHVERLGRCKVGKKAWAGEALTVLLGLGCYLLDRELLKDSCQGVRR